MHHYLQLAWNETMYWGPLLTNKECSRSHYQTLLCIYLASGNIWGTWWSDTLHWSHLTILGSNASDLSPSRFDPQRPHFGHWDLPLLPVLVLPLLPVLVLPLLPVSCRCVNACCQFCHCLAMLRGNLAKWLGNFATEPIVKVGILETSLCNKAPLHIHQRQLKWGSIADINLNCK